MSGGNNQGDPTILLFVVIVFMAIFAWLMWYLTGNFWLNYVLRWLRFGELWVLNIFTHHYDDCLNWLRIAQTVPHVPNVNQIPPLPSGPIFNATNACFGSANILRLPAAEEPFYYYLTLPPMIALGAEASHFYRWPVGIILGIIGFREILFSPKSKFRTKHSLETFIQVQAKMWPVISPIVNFNPSKFGRILGSEIPDKIPTFAEALSPEEWISWCRIPVVNGIPDRDAARRAFTQQLGPRWTGIDSAPLHYRALFAACALKGAQKREDADRMLGQLALAWTKDKGFNPDAKLRADINRIIADPEMGGHALKIADQHAWRTTALLGVLKWARSQGGVLAPAQFLWIRGEDRALWYPLNNLGRRSFHTEGAGAMAHFMAELAAQKPLPIPRVETAIVTLNTYLHDPDKRPTAIPPRAGESKA